MQGQIKLLKHSKLTLSLVLGLLATSSSAWADQTDTYNRRLKGNYGFAATGYFPESRYFC
jgi:hypothetical protein